MIYHFHNNVDANGTPLKEPFLFALLRVDLQPKGITKSAHAPTHATTAMTKKRDTINKNTDEDDSDMLPLSLYMLDMNQQVLISIDYDQKSGPPPPAAAAVQQSHVLTWTLCTATSERIAVERVMRYHPPSNPSSGGTTTTTMAPYMVATQPIQQSLYAIHDRLLLLEQSLQHIMTTTTTTTTNVATKTSTLSLLRHVQGLLLHMGTMIAFVSNHTTTTTTKNCMQDVVPVDTTTTTTVVLLQQLSKLAHTVTTIQQYTDKLRFLQQHDTTISTSMSHKNTSAMSSMVGPSSSSSSLFSSSRRSGGGSSFMTRNFYE
jgi:hypothetical protein